MKYVDPGQYLLSPIPSNEEQQQQQQEQSARLGFGKVLAALRKSSGDGIPSQRPIPSRNSSFQRRKSSHIDGTLTPDLASTTDGAPVDVDKEEEKFSLLLSLPLEILHRIIELVYYDNNTSSISSNLENFSKTMPLLSRTMNALSLRFLYKYAIFNRPHAFDKFMQNVARQPDIGLYVEFMDFQQFTSVGLGRTGRMNQEIQMVTSQTIHHALRLCPNLLEFLASENIQDDMDVGVLDCLFNGMWKLQGLDFCGASSGGFARAFQELQIRTEADGDAEMDESTGEPMDGIIENVSNRVALLNTVDESTDSSKPKSSLNHLLKLSFHDCSNITADTFAKLLPHLTSLRRLDLNHTSVTSTLLNTYTPPLTNLTHLSLSRCSKLTTRDLILFLTSHPALTSGRLRWLSLQTDSNVVSPLSDAYLLHTLRHLKAPRLQFLNLGGLPVAQKHLVEIKSRFPHLNALHISHAAAIEPQHINEYLANNSNIKYIDITGCKRITRWNITQILQTNFHSNLVAVEFDYKLLMELTASGEYVKITQQQQSLISDLSSSSSAPQIWKFYDNQGRRSWIYKVETTDPYYKSVVNSTSTSSHGIPRPASVSNLTYYDLETGKKITQKFKKPDFLKYASRKISCSIGYHRLQDAKKKPYIDGIEEEEEQDVWPAEFSQRGIYNYYSLNVK
ncbi:hypothetical protein CAAN1_20S02608 [[Candida] anglica]|uniref:F-box domain-containing protein n=1 Tax=[Candida] anglica TaxID=148631 RepID=A0ABP0EGV2_9ASCO